MPYSEGLADKDGQEDNKSASNNAATIPAVDTDMLNTANLPKDLGRLTALRDELSDYLSTLERNTQAVNEWLTEHEMTIVSQHHRLMRAVTSGDEAAAKNIVANIGEAVGFVLDISDFRKLAVEQFGKDSTLATIIDTAEKGLPSYLLEDLPEVNLNKRADRAADMIETLAPEAPKPAPKKSFWNKLTGTQSKEEKELARAEAERKAFEEKTMAHWRDVRSELITLQSDRNYFVDSFMDWAGESLLGEKPQEETDKLLYNYQEPGYVINLAQQDYAKVMEGKTESLRAKTKEYTNVATLLDNKDVRSLIRKLDSLYQGPKGKSYRDVLLSDPHYQGKNFAEVALNYITNREDQFALFSKAIQHEKLAFKDASSNKDIFDKILNECLNEKNPLNPAALSLTMKYINAAEAPEQYNAFAEIYDALSSDPERMVKVLEEFSNGLSHSPYILPIVYFNELDKALNAYSHADITNALDLIANSNEPFAGLQTAAMWQLCKPADDLFYALTRAGDVRGELDRVLRAHEAGVIDELKYYDGAGGRYSSVWTLFNETVMGNLQDTSLQNTRNVRKLIGHVFANGGLDVLRDNLENKYISQVWAADLSTDHKRLWTSILLEPFSSDITKANILAKAAESASTPSMRLQLEIIEEQFASRNLRLSHNSVLNNIGRIASLWYKESESAIQYTVAGETPSTLVGNIKKHEAREILDYLERKHDFMKEYGGLFNPSHIDRFVETEQGELYMGWTGPQGVAANVTDDTKLKIQNDPRFIHGQIFGGNTRIHLNLDSVAVIQIQENGRNAAILDKYGVSYQVVMDQAFTAAASDWVNVNNSYVRPSLISVATFDPSKNQVGLRIESGYFDQILGANEIFLPLREVNAQDYKNLETAFKDSDGVISYQNTSGPVYFNVGASGFMSYHSSSTGNKNDAGFRYHKHGALNGNTFIPAHIDMVKGLYEDAKTKKSLITVENLTFAVGSIENIYYAPKEGALCIQSDKSMQKVKYSGDKPEEMARFALDTLSKVAALRPDLMQMRYASPTGGAPVLDLIDMSKTVALNYNPAENRVVAQVTLKNPVHILMDDQNGPEFIDRIEKEGLPQERQLDLQPVLASLGPLRIAAQPSLESSDVSYLIDLTRGTTTPETRPCGDLKEEFAIAANKRMNNAAYIYGGASRPVVSNDNGTPDKIPDTAIKPRLPKL